MPKFVVPVTITLSGSLTVDVKDSSQALKAAKKEYYRLIDEHFKNGGKSVAENTVIDGVDVDVDFDEDEENYELDEE